MTGHRSVVLIRGINVGGSRTVPMAGLRDLCAEAGCTDITTYNQSGNLVLDTTLTDARLADVVAAGIGRNFGFRPSVMVRRPAALERVVRRQPFGEDATADVHVGFLSRRPSPGSAASLEGLEVSPEQVVVDGRVVYLHLPLGMGRSPLMQKVPLERALGVDVTVRNWRTVTALVTLAKR